MCPWVTIKGKWQWSRTSSNSSIVPLTGFKGIKGLFCCFAEKMPHDCTLLRHSSQNLLLVATVSDRWQHSGKPPPSPQTLNPSPNPPLTCCSSRCSCCCRSPRPRSSFRCCPRACCSPPMSQHVICCRGRGCPKEGGLVGVAAEGWLVGWKATRGCCGRWRRRCRSRPPPPSPPSSPPPRPISPLQSHRPCSTHGPPPLPR